MKLKGLEVSALVLAPNGGRSKGSCVLLLCAVLPVCVLRGRGSNSDATLLLCCAVFALRGGVSKSDETLLLLCAAAARVLCAAFALRGGVSNSDAELRELLRLLVLVLRVWSVCVD